tara:strand:+ start:399 stop:962 length:564 start_codon:yes stop_codon:yes gene_type:complete
MNDMQFFEWMQSDPEKKRILEETIKVLNSDTDLGHSLREEYFQNDNEKMKNEINLVKSLKPMTKLFKAKEQKRKNFYLDLESLKKAAKEKREREERKKEERERKRERYLEEAKINSEIRRRIAFLEQEKEEKRITVTGYMGGNDFDTARKKLYNQQVTKEMEERKILIKSLQYEIKITAPKKKKRSN